MKIKNVIGGIEEKKVSVLNKGTACGIESRGFNSCLNTKVSVDEEVIAYTLFTLNRLSIAMSWEALPYKVKKKFYVGAKAIAEVIKQGEIIKRKD